MTECPKCKNKIGNSISIVAGGPIHCGECEHEWGWNVDMVVNSMRGAGWNR